MMSKDLDFRYLALAAVAGLIFGFALYISQMTHPLRVLHYLDVTTIPANGWDPSLAFGMATALVVMFVAVSIGRTWQKPLFYVRFHESEFTRIDAPLVMGAVLF